MRSLTNYLISLTTFSLLAGVSCSGAETPAARPPATRPPAASAPAAPPPAASPPAAAAPASAASRYVQKAGTGSLTFAFVQAGAENQGSFRQFATELRYDASDPAAGSLKVTVQIASLDTQEKDRNAELAKAELLDVNKYPTAQYVAGSLAKRADGGLEAVGKLTLRGVTRDLRLPLTIRQSAAGLELSGETTIKRLDYGVGQGEWKSTEWVGDEVKLQYKVPLAKAG
jgi:polyisoprenoid-binding protein YceI